jgi:uncharacterized membrane protein YoaK (UPF0700 family)
MGLKLDLVLMFLFIVGTIISYFLAKKYQNKKLLIVTYVFLFLILCSLIYAILDIIVVGGI